jgi:hypothetical protein
VRIPGANAHLEPAAADDVERRRQPTGLHRVAVVVAQHCVSSGSKPTSSRSASGTPRRVRRIGSAWWAWVLVGGEGGAYHPMVHCYWNSGAESIYGGANEIQRNIVGLPR